MCSPAASPSFRLRCAAPHESTTDSRFAVVTMTRRPYRFDAWLAYYRALGTDHIFIAVEDSPDVEALVADAPWSSMVTATRSEPELNPYETVITRQERVMEWALAECEALGIPWLFHLDDDELLHLGQPWQEIVAQANPSGLRLPSPLRCALFAADGVHPYSTRSPGALPRHLPCPTER